MLVVSGVGCRGARVASLARQLTQNHGGYKVGFGASTGSLMFPLTLQNKVESLEQDYTTLLKSLNRATGSWRAEVISNDVLLATQDTGFDEAGYTRITIHYHSKAALTSTCQQPVVRQRKFEKHVEGWLQPAGG